MLKRHIQIDRCRRFRTLYSIVCVCVCDGFTRIFSSGTIDSRHSVISIQLFVSEKLYAMKNHVIFVQIDNFSSFYSICFSIVNIHTTITPVFYYKRWCEPVSARIIKWKWQTRNYPTDVGFGRLLTIPLVSVCVLCVVRNRKWANGYGLEWQTHQFRIDVVCWWYFLRISHHHSRNIIHMKHAL